MRRYFGGSVQKILKINPDNPTDPNRDRFILSKGHAAPAPFLHWQKKASLIKKIRPVWKGW